MEDHEYISENVRRNTHGFDFTETIGLFAINDRFRNGLTTLKHGVTSQNTYVWEVLSAMNTDIADTIYENVLNYIDNAANIDTCKVQALGSMLKLIGIQYSLFSTYDNIPKDILNIVDVFSINKRYLGKIGFLKDTTYAEISSYAYSEGNQLSGLLSDTLSVCGYLNEDKLLEYINDTYLRYLSSIVNMKYADRTESTETSDCVWYGMRDLLVRTNSEVLTSEFHEFRRVHNISPMFDEVVVVDAIDDGRDSIDNYNGYNLELLKLEIDRRSLPITPNRKQTRYNYYRQKIIKEYFNFIENIVTSLDLISSVSNAKYDIDNNYILLKDSGENTQKKLLYIDENGNYVINSEMIVAAAKNLTDITIELQRIRDSIKIESLKNYMRGTYNLLKYMINEYLIGLAKSNVLNSSSDLDIEKIRNNLTNHLVTDINQIEYFDTTEYFNIDTGLVESPKLNPRYWSDDSIDYNSNYSFGSEQISNFYENTLNCKNGITDIDDFLCSLYEAGASKTYVDDNGSIIYGNQLLSVEEREILMSYGGNKFSYYPYLNHKNTIHPSFLIHPYIKKFVAYTGYEYPIKNAFYNDANLGLEDSIVSNLVGQYGETINVAMNNQYDFSGYKTKYEESIHSVNGSVCDVIDFEGAFFPSAVDDFRNDTVNFIKSVRNQEIGVGYRSYYEKYYSHLGLSREQTERIANQLSDYYDDIKSITDRKTNKNEVSDIYRYACDIYGNVYILYKKYESDNPSFSERKNTTGLLWIRIKNHPIAFPAFSGVNSNVDNDITKINGNIPLLANVVDGKHDMNRDDMEYFYDFEMDTTKRSIFLIAYPKNDEINHDVSELSSDSYKNILFADTIICNLDYLYDILDRYYKLRFLSDTTLHINEARTYGILAADKVKWDENSKLVYCFIGIYHISQKTEVVYALKRITKDSDSSISFSFDLGLNLILFRVFQYIYRYSHKEYSAKLPLYGIVQSHLISNADIKFSYLNDIYTFAFVLNELTTSFSYRTYAGLNGVNFEQTNLTDLSTDEGNYNSYDRFLLKICVIETTYSNGEFVMTTLKPKFYNLNADASYYPQYVGLKGFLDFGANEYLELKLYIPILLLGQSNRFLSTISESISNDTAFTYDTIKNLDNQSLGLVYEDYFDTVKNVDSYKMYSCPAMGYFYGNLNIKWDIIIDDLVVSKLSDYMLVIGNRNSSSNNLYYLGSFGEISTYNEMSSFDRGFISLAEKYGSYIKPEGMCDITDSNDSQFVVAGTCNMFNELTNRIDTNYLYGVDDLLLKYEGKTKLLIFKFITKGQWLVRELDIYVIMFNMRELRMYELFQLFEPKNLGLTYENLSGIQLSSYRSLSDISYLSGYDNLTFMYADEDAFHPSDIRFYRPGYNTEYPIRVCDVFLKMLGGRIFDDFRKENQKFCKNQYVFRIDGMEGLEDFGTIRIGYSGIETNQLIAFEDFISTDYLGFDNQNKYDDSSVKMYEFAAMTDSNMISSEQLYEQLLSFISNKSSYEKFDANSNYILQNFGTEALYTEDYNPNTSMNIEYIPRLSNLLNIEKFNNIYVLYDIQDGLTILYFNYMNLYNTPFINIVDGEQVKTTIEGTYLKLRPGEDGILNIYIQIKNYLDNRTIVGLKNIKVASYRIYNISDDKPKFLVQKMTDKMIALNPDDGIVPLVKIQVSNITIQLSSEELLNDKIDFSLDSSVFSNKPIQLISYTLKYDVSELSLINEYITSDTRGLITIDTTDTVRLNFRTNYNMQHYKDIGVTPKFNIMVVDDECYVDDEIVECNYEHGYAHIYGDDVFGDNILLATEYKSDDNDDWFRLETNKLISSYISIKGV